MPFGLPYIPGGEIYTVFDEESDFQVKNSQFRRLGSKARERKNLVKKTMFKILVF